MVSKGYSTYWAISWTAAFGQKRTFRSPKSGGNEGPQTAKSGHFDESTPTCCSKFFASPFGGVLDSRVRIAGADNG